MRYLNGSAFAVNHTGEIRSVSIDDIYTLAKDLAPEGTHISTATY